MGCVKFTFVKLIFKYYVLICSIILLSCGYNQAGNLSASREAVANLDSGNEANSESIRLNDNQNPELSSQEVDSAKTQLAANKQETKEITSRIRDKQENLSNSILNIFLSNSEIETLKNDLLKFGKDHLPGNLRPTYITIIERVFDYPFILLLVAFTLFFIINIASVIIILNYTIKRKAWKEKFETIYRKMYEEVLLAYLFGSIDWDTVLIKLKRKNKKENRRILTGVLMNFRVNFKGEFEQLIPEIYTRLNLQDDSLKLARSVYHHKKVEGIMELIHLYPDGAKGIINKLINDPSDYVRAEAQTAYVRLNPETPFNFFYTLKKPFALWTQLSVFNLIRINQLAVPSFAQFLDMEHSNIRNFSLRMITFFQQLEDVSEVIRMVDQKQDRTRFLAYKAINDLRLYDSRELIKSRFENETEKNKLEILKALRNIGTNDDFDFLEKVMKTGSISLKTEACRSMYFMSLEGKEKINHMDRQSIPEMELLIAHVTDPRN